MGNGTSLEVYGTNKNWLHDLEHCRWNIDIGKMTAGTGHARIAFEDFHFDGNRTSCGESLITLRNETTHLFHFCSTIQPEAEFEVYGTDLVLEVVRKGWEGSDGFKLNFIME